MVTKLHKGSDLPSLIFRRRAKNRITLSEAARQIGITKSHLHDIEHRKYDPRWTTIAKILAWMDRPLPVCGATEWGPCDDGRPHVYRICTLARGHESRFHTEERAGKFWAESSGDDGPIPEGSRCKHWVPNTRVEPVYLTPGQRKMLGK